MFLDGISGLRKNMQNGNVEKESTGKGGPHGFEEAIIPKGSESKRQWADYDDDEDEKDDKGDF